MALGAVADDDDVLALDQVQVGIAIVIDAHGGVLSRVSGFGSGFRPAVEGQELLDGTGRVAPDPGGIEIERVAEKKSDLNIAAD